MYRNQLMGLLILGPLALAACSDGVSPGSEVPEDVRQELVQLLDESGFFADEFGDQGAVNDGSASAASASFLAEPDGEVTAPRLWGRRRGLPVRRQVTIEVNPTEGTAVAWKEVEFDGRFLLDITDDDQVNPTEKPLQDILMQHAEFERLAQEEIDEQGRRRRWRLVAVSPAQFVMADPAKQTVAIAQITVEVNGAIVADITDPAEPLLVNGRVPRLQRGDEVVVTASVSNENQEHTPPTFVFLHLFHASPNARIWLRLPMEEGEPGMFSRSWTVRHTGRERIAVDAIDSETFTTESEDDYRANIWGIPYVVLDDAGA